MRRGILHQLLFLSLMAFGEFNAEYKMNLMELAEKLNLTTFADNAMKTGLARVINHEGSFTLFAPTNEAFERQIHYPNGKGITEMMTFHVGQGNVTSSQMNNEMMIHSLLTRRSIRINMYRNGQVLTANGRLILSTNHVAHNGVIHVLDNVMSSVYERDGSVISELYHTCPQVSTFVELVKIADMFSLLNDRNKELTLLAPTNLAFSKIDVETLSRLKKNKKQLRDVLKNHVIEGTYYSAGFVNGQILRSLTGNSIKIFLNQSHIGFDGAFVSMGDLTGSNGVIHMIDEILLGKESHRNPSPTYPSPPTPLSSILRTYGFNKFAKAFEVSNMSFFFDSHSNEEYTIFAPSDEAFTFNDTDFSSPSSGDLENIISQYIVPGFTPIKYLPENEVLKTICGHSLRIGRITTLEGTSIMTINGIPSKPYYKVIYSEQIMLYSLSGAYTNASQMTGANETIYSELIRRDHYNLFIQLMTDFGMRDLLSNPSAIFTIFVMNDTILESKLSTMSKKEIASNFLSHHFVTGALYSRRLVNDGVIKTLSGAPISVTKESSGIRIGNVAKILLKDITVTNGVIYEVDHLIQV